MTSQGRTVEVTINGTSRAVDAGQTIPQLLATLGLDPRLVVVEHNREIVDRAKLPDVEVRDGDNLEIVHFVGGG